MNLWKCWIYDAVDDSRRELNFLCNTDDCLSAATKLYSLLEDHERITGMMLDSTDVLVEASLVPQDTLIG